MASINKLSIRGIRSFSPEDSEQVVEFFFPITIIVGANGCGKTTIIESLKYAVTGAFPPGNKSGQAFVHDPRSLGQSVVKANVKLRFTSRSGETMVVVRSMEVTQKKTTMTFKQLDGVIRTMDPVTGQRVSLSHKCTELDKQLPTLLGVSKPILEHVVFCHQEDSSWPLQEGAVLKKRFDEIFDSTRYTKALESFRKTEKDLLGTVKDLKAELAGLSSHMHAAKQFRHELAEHTEQLELLDDEKKRLSEMIVQAEQEAVAQAEIINRVEELNDEMENVKTERAQQQHLIAKQRELLRNDSEQGGADDDDLTQKHSKQELQRMLSDFDAQIQDVVSRKEQLELQAQQLERDMEGARQEQVQLTSNIGKFQAEKEAHEKSLRARFTKMEDLAGTYSVQLQLTPSGGGGGAGTQDPDASFAEASLAASTAGGGGIFSLTQPDDGDSHTVLTTITPADMQSFFSALDRKETQLRTALQSHRSETRSNEDKLQQMLNSLYGKMQSIEDERAKLTAQRAKLQQEHNELNRESASAGGAGGVRIRQSDIEDTRKQAQKFAKELEAATNDPRRSEIPVEIRQLEEKMDRIKRMLEDDRMCLESLRHSADAQNAISVLQEQCKKDLEALEEAIQDYSYAYTQYHLNMPKDLPREGDDRGEELVHAMERTADQVKNKYDTELADLEQAKADMSKTQQQVSEKKALLANNQHSIRSVRTKLDRLAGEHGSVSKFQQIVEQLREHEKALGLALPPAVVVNVENDPAGQNDPRTLLTYLDERLEAVEEDAPNVEAPELARKILKKLRKMSKVRVDGPEGFKLECPCCRREMMTDEVAIFKNSIDELMQDSPLVKVDEAAAAQYRETKARYTRWKKEITVRLDDLRDYRRMQDELAGFERDARIFEDDLARYQSTLDQQKEQVATDQKVVDELREFVEATRRWTQEAGRIAEKRMQINQKFLELSVSQTDSTRDMKTVEREIQERTDEKDTITNKINQLNKEMTALNNKISQLNLQSTRMDQHARDKEAKFAAEQKATQRKNEILEQMKSLTEEELKLQDQIPQLSQKIKARESEKQKLRNLANEEEQTLNETLNRFVSDVSQLRDLNRQIEQYASSDKPDELARLQAKVAKALDKVEEKREELKALTPVLEQARSAVNDQQRHKKRLKESIDILDAEERVADLGAEIARLKTELNGVEGRETAYARHTEAKERKDKHLAAKARIEGRWSEIVEQIRSLKRKLSTEEYKDVDEQHRVALIKSETTRLAAEDIKRYYTALDKALLQYHSVKIAEINKIIRELWLLTYKGEDIGNIELVSGQEPGSRAQKSYNYRVVMTKGSTQMDMRGRCSAGQRVVASIVIRLALAETFGVNCGCIALDEPTVNLDYKNKKGLAIALAQIVALRAQQSNFQLILITHDEEFVSMMKTELSSMTGFSMPDKYFQVRREAAADGKYYSKIDAVDWDELI